MEAFSAYGPAGAVVIVVLLFLNYMQKQNEERRKDAMDELKRKEKMYKGLTDASKKTAKAIDENSKLIRNLNGKLTQAIIDKEESNYRERRK